MTGIVRIIPSSKREFRRYCEDPGEVPSFVRTLPATDRDQNELPACPEAETCTMAEDGGLEPPSPKAPVFKTGGLPIILVLRKRVGSELSVRNGIHHTSHIVPHSAVVFHARLLDGPASDLGSACIKTSRRAFFLIS